VPGSSGKGGRREREKSDKRMKRREEAGQVVENKLQQAQEDASKRSGGLRMGNVSGWDPSGAGRKQRKWALEDDAKIREGGESARVAIPE